MNFNLPCILDLADQLPESLPSSFIKDSILNARESCVSVDSIMKAIDKGPNKTENHELRSMVTDNWLGELSYLEIRK